MQYISHLKRRTIEISKAVIVACTIIRHRIWMTGCRTIFPNKVLEGEF
jgi:hypothetical protein